jgi:GH43 family beta-xylosidase
MIRHATINDLVQIMNITQDAVTFLRDHQIPQWQNHYPNEKTFSKDIENNTLYVAEMDGLICGMANIALESDPQYNVIYDGAWLTEGPYAVVHRIAVRRSCLGTGVAKNC